MTTEERFEQLKKRDMATKSEKGRAMLEAEFTQLADSDPEGFEAAVLASAKNTLQAAKQLKIKEQMGEISQIISMSYIAKNYFNKTKGWLSQRVNGNEVNGKPAQFTQEELEILNTAFADLSKKISLFRVS